MFEWFHFLQLMIRRASSVLYRATKKRAYFKDVRILVPESWSNIRANLSTWETYSVSILLSLNGSFEFINYDEMIYFICHQLADVRVAPPRSTYGNMPYTIQSGGCGQPGEYIHLTPDYLRTLTDPNNTATFGPPGNQLEVFFFFKFRIWIKLSFIISFTEKVFVHEWSHLRYGVFDEYGYQGDTKYPLFYKKPGANAIQVNLCTNNPPIFTTKFVDYTSILIFFASNTNYKLIIFKGMKSLKVSVKLIQQLASTTAIAFTNSNRNSWRIHH